MLVPPGLDTVTCTVPAPSAGAVAVTDVGELILKSAALSEPKLTAVASSSSVPVIATVVPPDSRHATGATLVIVGGLGSVSKRRSSIATGALPAVLTRSEK